MNFSWRSWIKSNISDYPMAWTAMKKVQGWQYAAEYLYYYNKKLNTLASTSEINVEFSSACNLRCRFCALDHLKPKTYISTEVIDRLFQSLLEDRRFDGVRRINLYNGGETLMHPRRVEIFERIKWHQELFKVYDRKFPKVVLLTNGMLLREKLAREILSLKVVDEFGFSLDGGSPESFEDLRVNAKWEKFARNVNDFITLKNEIHPEVRTFGITIVPKPNALNNKWMHSEFREVIALLDQMEYRRLHDWGGQVEIDGEKSKPPVKIGCEMLMKQLVLLPDGNVTVCCNDLNGEGIVGNIMESELYDIYNSDKRHEYLSKLFQKRKDELPLCRDCESF